MFTEQNLDDFAGQRTWLLPDQLRRLRPEAIGLMEMSNALALRRVDARLMELIRLRVAGILGNQDGRRRRSARVGLGPVTLAEIDDYYRCPAFSDEERGRIYFAEQFAIDVAQIGEAEVNRLGHDDLAPRRSLVLAIFLSEFMQRLEMISTRLLGGPATDPEGAGLDGVDVSHCDEVGAQQTWWDFQAAVQRGRALDPLVTETIRLFCARTHHCRMCQTLRLADARAAGADDAFTDKITRYEASDLDERYKVTLRIVDAFITQPTMLGDETVARAREIFTPEELAEICLDIVKWSSQKNLVALDLDGADQLPVGEDSVSYFVFGEDGEVAWMSATPVGAEV